MRWNFRDTNCFRFKLNGRYGFTLIEVIIAISILSMILSIAYSALNQIISSKRMLDDRRDAGLIADAVLLRMTRELQLIYLDETGRVLLLPPRDKVDEKVPPNATIIGEPSKLDNGEPGDSIKFLALEGGQYLPDGGTHSGIVQISYRVEPDPDQQRGSQATYYLIRDETPYKTDPKEAYKDSMIFPVTANLVSLGFEYYDQEKEEWATTWGEENKRKLPSMIRFSISMRSPAGVVETYATAVPIRAAR